MTARTGAGDLVRFVNVAWDGDLANPRIYGLGTSILVPNIVLADQ